MLPGGSKCPGGAVEASAASDRKKITVQIFHRTVTTRLLMLFAERPRSATRMLGASRA